MSNDTKAKFEEALDDHAIGLEGALQVVERESPIPFERPDTPHEHIANAIVQAANIQAAAAILVSARKYVTT